MMTFLCPEDIRRFAFHFAIGFLPGCEANELREWSEDFVGNEGLLHSGKISIDMIKTFLMKRISIFRSTEMLDEEVGPDIPFIVPEAKQRSFLSSLAEKEPLQAHLLDYPNVGVAMSEE